MGKAYVVIEYQGATPPETLGGSPNLYIVFEKEEGSFESERSWFCSIKEKEGFLRFVYRYPLRSNPRVLEHQYVEAPILEEGLPYLDSLKKAGAKPVLLEDRPSLFYACGGRVLADYIRCLPKGRSRDDALHYLYNYLFYVRADKPAEIDLYGEVLADFDRPDALLFLCENGKNEESKRRIFDIIFHAIPKGELDALYEENKDWFSSAIESANWHYRFHRFECNACQELGKFVRSMRLKLGLIPDDDEDTRKDVRYDAVYGDFYSDAMELRKYLLLGAVEGKIDWLDEDDLSIICGNYLAELDKNTGDLKETVKDEDWDFDMHEYVSSTTYEYRPDLAKAYFKRKWLEGNPLALSILALFKDR